MEEKKKLIKEGSKKKKEMKKKKKEEKIFFFFISTLQLNSITDLVNLLNSTVPGDLALQSQISGLASEIFDSPAAANIKGNRISIFFSSFSIFLL